MTPSIVAVLAIGGLLGFRHAFEPDHLAAVSTLATRPSARLWSAARLGLVWGLGHTVTVGAVALLIIALGISLPDRFWPAAELLVAALLVLLGSLVIWPRVRTFISTATAPMQRMVMRTRWSTRGVRWASGSRTVWRGAEPSPRSSWRPRPTSRRGSSTSRRSAWARSSGC